MADASPDYDSERPASQKAPDAFRTISEVSVDLDIPQHVLRFWDGKFTQIKPLKRGGGRRYYRPEDVDLLRGIQHLLYGDGYTIRGVQKLLREHGVKFVVAAGRKRLEQQQARMKPAPRIVEPAPVVAPVAPAPVTADAGLPVPVEVEAADAIAETVPAAEPQETVTADLTPAPAADRMAAAAQLLSRLKAIRREYDLRLQAAKNGRRAA
ncbi:MAG: MerR family transcriptional regulator [Alphaproteobacteria bacterium]|nr:MerR family transcriptional regulator [Alphaproteobacteria bacterium]